MKLKAASMLALIAACYLMVLYVVQAFVIISNLDLIPWEIYRIAAPIGYIVAWSLILNYFIALLRLFGRNKKDC